MLYNWMDRVSMSISKVDRPFMATKEMHPSTIQALINVCSKIGSFIMDLIYLHPQVCVPSQKIHSQFLHQNFCLTIFHLVGNIIRACQSLGCHILTLESNMDVFIEVLEPR
jgi:hypothetical protein